MTRRALAIVIIGTLALQVGCGEATDQDSYQQIQLLAKVPRPNGNVVEFHEVAPGMILVSEIGQIGVKPSLTDAQLDMDAHSLMEAIKPAGMQVPRVFIEAARRQQELRQTGAVLDTGTWAERPVQKLPPEMRTQYEDRGDIGQKRSAIFLTTHNSTGQTGSSSWLWFQDTLCKDYGHFNWCHLSRIYWPDFMPFYDVHKVQTYVAAWSGDVLSSAKYRTWWTWTTAGSWTVKQGYYRYWGLKDLWIDFDMQAAVTGVGGYHHAGHGYY